MADSEPTTEDTGTSEVDGEEKTELDSGHDFEYGANDQERENNNEQEGGIDGEKGDKNIEEERLEEKEETLSQFISANRCCGSEEFKLEYEGTFVLSTLNEEQKSAQADLLTSLSANPEQAMMLPDHVEGKTTFFTAAKMDNEGNLKYEIRSFTPREEEKEEKPIDKVEGAKLEEATLNLELNIDIDKQEDVDKETLIGQSLLTEVEAVSEVDAEQAQEITQIEEQSFSISEVQHADVEQVISMEETQSGFTSVGKYVNIDNTHYDEQVVIEAKEDTEKVITERIIDLLKDEPQADFIEEANTVIGITETEQSLKDTQEYNTEGGTINSEPLVVAVEDKTEKVITLEDRIRELFRDEVEPTEIVFEQVQTFEVQNVQQKEIVADVEVEVVGNQVEIHETVQASHIENIQQQRTEVEQTFSTEQIEVDVVEEKPEEVVIVNQQENKASRTIEQVITQEVNGDIEVGKPEHATMEQARIEETNIVVENNEDKNITLQEVEVSESLINEMVGVSKETSVNSNQEAQKVININETTERNTIIEEIKVEEEVVEKVQSSDVMVEAVVNMPQEISKVETILSEVVNEVPVAESKEVQEVVDNNIQAQGIAKAETVSYITDSDKIETQNVLSINIENTKEEKADQNKESPVVIKSEEKIIVETKGIEINLKTEKTDNVKFEKITPERIITERRIQDRKEKPEKVILNNGKDIKITNTRESRAKLKDVEIKATKPVAEKTNREAIVLKFNRNTANNTARNEAPRSLEKPREEKRTTEESLKAKPLNGHEILLQILGISQDTMESRNAEPTNSRSVPNINQEEQETKSTKSIPSMYQPRNLNGITLKIAA